MKRLSVILIALMLLVSSAAADVPDLSGLTKEELLSVVQQAQNLLFDEELVNGIRVPQGHYTIGIDIPAGTYRIEITDGTGYYDVFDRDGGYRIVSGLTGSLYNITEIGKITFEDGNILDLVNSTFIFYPYTGIFH